MSDPKKILHMIIMGDSLSDRGTIAKRYLFNVIPMSWLSGIQGISPEDRFTNGYVWADVISAFVAGDFFKREVKKKYHWDNEMLANSIIAKDRRVTEALNYDYKLNNDLYVKFEGQDFIRSYDEGGLTSDSYAWEPSTSISRFFSRIILSTLTKKRKKLLQYDKDHNLDTVYKEHTLIIEWSGANDLITVNARPSVKEVGRAIAARVKNVEELIKNGYRNFILFNLPDLSFTPHFQNMVGQEGLTERNNASACIQYFNEQLLQAGVRLKTLYPHCDIDVFDVNTIFLDVQHHPQQYRIDPNKLTKPFIYSPDFKKLPNGTMPAKGYFYWDDKHPTSDLHALFANKFYEKYTNDYFFIKPTDPKLHALRYQIAEDDLVTAFRVRYQERLNQDRHSFFKSKRSHFSYQTANLNEIVTHALDD